MLHWEGKWEILVYAEVTLSTYCNIMQEYENGNVSTVQVLCGLSDFKMKGSTLQWWQIRLSANLNNRYKYGKSEWHDEHWLSDDSKTADQTAWIQRGCEICTGQLIKNKPKQWAKR
jgi:hypothetical protein